MPKTELLPVLLPDAPSRLHAQLTGYPRSRFLDGTGALPGLLGRRLEKLPP